MPLLESPVGGGPILLVKVGKEAEEGVGQPCCPTLITATLAAQVSETHQNWQTAQLGVSEIFRKK